MEIDPGVHQSIVNLKYIPTSKQPLANIQKIREMVHQNALSKKSPRSIPPKSSQMNSFSKKDEANYNSKKKLITAEELKNLNLMNQN